MFLTISRGQILSVSKAEVLKRNQTSFMQTALALKERTREVIYSIKQHIMY